jgi:RHS repeat-associated protein
MRYLPAIFILGVLALPVAAQKDSLDELGFNPGKLYDFSSVDSVNLFNGNLTLSVPLGIPYPVSSTLSYQFTLAYNSKIWDQEIIPNSITVPNMRSNAGLGWRLTLGRLLAPNDTTIIGLSGSNSLGEYVYEGPAGDEHPFARPGGGGNVEQDAAQVSGQLRLVKINSTVREVEFPSGEVHRFELEHSLWRLKQMRDRFTGHVDISYDYVNSQSPRETAWHVTDSTGREHSVQLGYWPTMQEGWSRGAMVNSLTVQAFNGASATYSFGYTSYPLNGSSCQHYYTGLPALSTVSLPDGTAYRFDYVPGACDVLGEVRKVTYPTGGTVAYTWGGYSLMLDGSSDWRAGVCSVASTPSAITSRTVSDGTSTRTWDYIQQLGPTVPVTFSTGDPCDTQQTNPSPPPGPIHWSRTSVVSPAGNDNKRVRTDHYFSVYSGNVDGQVIAPLPGEGYDNYGYPGTVGAPSPNGVDTDGSDGGLRLLATQVFSGCDISPTTCTSGTLLRTTFERYAPGASNTPLLSARTRFGDDFGCSAACYTQSTVSDNNGLNQFQTTLLESNFPGTVPVTTTKLYPIWSIADQMSLARPWILETFTEKTRTENGATARELFCFDSTTGFLSRHAKLAAQTLASTDVLTAFESDGGGNVRFVRRYGGDTDPFDPSGGLCAMGLPAQAKYQVEQGFTNGILKSSRYYAPATGAPLSFFTTDREVDPSTGVVTAERDTTGLHTRTFAYEAKPARLMSMTTREGAVTFYNFTNAVGSADAAGFSPATVDTDTASGTLRSRFIFDGIGRVRRQGSLGPQGDWLAFETVYDNAGRVASVSQPESTGATPPSAAPLLALHKASTSYDPLDRPTIISAPDGSATTVSYIGIREKRRTISISGMIGPQAVTTLERFDMMGRLIATTENDGPAGRTTSYGYDIGNRLTSVTTPQGSDAQSRTLSYDQRGFLKAEHLPELGAAGNGTRNYFNYDAGGHAHLTVTGAVSLTTEFDDAERVKTLATTSGVTLKSFFYDDPVGTAYPQCAGGTCKGRMAAATRYNIVPDLGTVPVTELFYYDGLGGRFARRDEIIGSNLSFDGQSFFFTQSYNTLGLRHSLTYPCRGTNGSCLPADRTPPVSSLSYSHGVLTSVGSWATGITYQPNGEIDTVTHGNGVKEIWSADPSGMSRPALIRATDAFNAELWSTSAYSYDGAGNVAGIGATSYAYDPFGRLTRWTANGAGGSYNSTVRAYDDFGNYRFSASKACGPIVPGNPQRCYTSAPAALAINGTTNHYANLSYDDLGNVLGGAGQTYTYDSLGFMTGTNVGGRRFRYLYTPTDERIAVVEPVIGSDGVTQLTRTVWSLRDLDNRLLSTWIDDKTTGAHVFSWKEDMIWRGAALLAQLSPAGTRHYCLDHLGSPRLVTGATGNVLGRQNFDPFGSGGTSDAGSLQFAGMERDAIMTGQFADLPDYDHRRYFDLFAGRFLSPDPVSGSLSNPQSWNRYTYALNNPISYKDPTGMSTDTPACERKDLKCQQPLGFRIFRVRVNIIYANADQPSKSGMTLRSSTEAAIPGARRFFAASGILLDIHRFESDVSRDGARNRYDGEVYTKSGTKTLSQIVNAGTGQALTVLVSSDFAFSGLTDPENGTTRMGWNGMGDPAVLIDELAHALGNVGPFSDIVSNAVTDYWKDLNLWYERHGWGVSEGWERTIRPGAARLHETTNLWP